MIRDPIYIGWGSLVFGNHGYEVHPITLLSIQKTLGITYGVSWV